MRRHNAVAAPLAASLSAALSLAAAIGLAVGGCTRAPAPPADPWAAELELAREQVTDPEALAALEDGKVTDAEVARAREIAQECFDEKGVDASFDENGNLSVTHPEGGDLNSSDAVVTECSGDGYDLLRGLRDDMAYNPTNIPREQLLADCFKRFGLIPDSMTPEQLMKLDWDNPPWDRLSGDFDGCLDDPLHYPGGRPDLTPEEVGTSVQADTDGTVTP